MPDTMSDRRRKRRHQLSANINIIDQLRNQNLGQLVNLHEEGLMLIGQELGLNATYQISLILPNSINQHREFHLGIESLWSQKIDDDVNLFWTGCSIIDKSTVADACIQSLLNIRT